MHESVDSLGVILVKVPKHGVIRYICLGMSLVAPIHGGEFNGIPDEEDGQIVEYKVLHALLGIKLCGPAPNIANGVTRSFFSTNGRDAGQDWRLLANSSEELGIGQIRYILENFEFAKGAGGFCMNTPIPIMSPRESGMFDVVKRSPYRSGMRSRAK